jgi:isoquinoline 1-oxidoreductase beta subunit
VNPTKATRRDFLRIAATAAGGMLICSAAEPWQPNPYIRLDSDGTTTIWSKEPEIGQGVKTSLPMIVADEMDADWARVKVAQADLDPKRYGGQGSGGSDNVTSEWLGLRKAGAAARALIIQAAASRWLVPATECETGSGLVTHRPTGRKLEYGELAAAAALLTPPTDPVLKRREEFRLIGTRVPVADIHEIVTGRAGYGLDVKRPGMLYAVIEKSPVFAAAPKTIDDAAAKAHPGVRHVVVLDGMENPTHLMPGVAVVAESTWAAMQARKKLKISWDEGSGGSESSGELGARAIGLLAEGGKTLAHTGDVDRAFAAAGRTFEAEYQVPFLAHACMEPVNCVAEFRNGRCEIWGPMQMPGTARQLVARKLNIAPGNVTIHMTRIGGGFGRRLLCDYVVEAAYLAQQTGSPVQVVATREDDLRHDYYRPHSFHRLRAGVDGGGRIVAWDHHLAGVSRNAYRRDPRPPESTEVYGMFTANNPELKEQVAMMLLPTLIPNCRARYSELKTPVPTGAWRAPSHNALGFVIESFLDEIAHATGRSPFDIRSEILGNAADFPFRSEDTAPYDPARLRNVLAIAADKSNWHRRLPPGWGRGIAAHFTFGSYAAEVAEVSVDANHRLKVHRIVAAVDCGQVVNRSGVEAQAQGGILDGLSAALYGEITIDRGRTVESNFGDYRKLRIPDAPEVEVHIVESAEAPTGFGEIALPPCAGAVGNAVFDATGTRIRKLPFRTAGLTV